MPDKVYSYDQHTSEEWKEFLFLRSLGDRVEIDVSMFNYWLNVLPPRFMRRTVTLFDGTKQEVSFGFAEDYERVTAFWQDGERYFCQYLADKR